LARAALTITGWNAVSRLTGFVRVLAVGAALGTTFLGNTYQSSNLVSNLLFEVLAAGLLSAPLVPVFVGLIQDGRPGDARRLAGNLLGWALLVLGALVVGLSAGGHAVMRLLTVGVHDPQIRAAEVRLGAFFLWFFLPQLLLYGVGAVVSAWLTAERRFAAVAAAPVANNVIVSATMVAYIVVRHDAHPLLSLPVGHRLLLAAGTTAGVLAMAAVPVVALGIRRLRLGLDLRDPNLPTLARLGAWGGVLLAGTQVLIAVTLVLANRVEGGVVAYQIAYTFYLLPFALVAHPIFTSLYPRLSADAHAGRWTEFAEDLGRGVRRTALLVAPAAGLLAALGRPALQLVRSGALDRTGAGLVASVLAAYAVGLVGYSVFQLLARAATATGDARLPALVGLAAAAVGSAAMVAASAAAHGPGRVVVLGLCHSAAMLLAAAALAVLVERRVGQPLHLGRAAARAAVAGLSAWLAAAGVAHVVGSATRMGAAAAGLAGGAAGLAVVALALWALREPELRALVSRP